ncbi:MAG: redoxin family protein [Planctomycetaceae bacterium]|nr:redoxin family protein [Planctomycetaceae bacterium]MCB9949535.1 redoxin family protein [Planctomycetaceae bacterium]
MSFRTFLCLLSTALLSIGCIGGGGSGSDDGGSDGSSQQSSNEARNAEESTPQVSENAGVYSAVATVEEEPESDSIVVSLDDLSITQAKLNVGDPAPPLLVQDWVLGEAMNGFEPGKVHVVEMWATWCEPCRESMPHLSELQQDLGDEVTIIGVTSEDAETVQKFLNEKPEGEEKTWRESIGYRLALDDQEKMKTAWSQDSGHPGFPTTYIVGKEGRLEWIGHPDDIEEPLLEVVSGLWDRDRIVATARYEKVLEALDAKVEELARTGDWDTASAYIKAAEQEFGRTDSLVQLKLALRVYKANGAPGKRPTASSVVQSMATLKVGDPAPPIAIDQWATGEPIESLQQGKIYVVEFWATWCPPCRAGMPHISELQTQYGDEVTFIGVTREDRPTVDEFLASKQEGAKTWRDVVKYRLAIDQSDETSMAYMRAARQSGIPCAFLVGREGKVEWIGHPARIEFPLQQVVAGKWDRDTKY